MASLRKTLASLVRSRRQFVHPTPSPFGRTSGPPRFEDLTEVTGFGTNPGNLRMFKYVPDGLAADRALVVVLHGCTQAAAGYARAAGWVPLASELGFAVLAPEQQRANNANNCLNWFERADTMRDQGEAFSIWEMVERMVIDHRLDRRRVYVTGLSAGGAMACVMLAAYPDVFAAGAIVAGLPYRCADNVQQALAAMADPKPPALRSRGDLVRAASLHHGPWPRVSVWHGTNDRTVAPANAAAIAQQWCDVHGLADDALVQDTLDGQAHRMWLDARGAIAVETIMVDGLAHGTPIDAAGATGRPLGTAAPFVIDVGISSTRRIAARWGLDTRSDDRAARAETASPAEPERSSGGVVEPVARGALTALRKILPRSLLPAPLEPDAGSAGEWSIGEWSTAEPREPGAASAFFGYASSGIACVGGLNRKSMSRRLKVRPGQRLVYERRLHLHAGINILTNAAFRVTIDGESVDREAVVFANRMEHDWTRREIELSRWAGRNAELRLEVSADCNVCIEVFAKAWVRGLRVEEPGTEKQRADSDAVTMI